jgi:pyrroloquinoline-quinone synthase
LVGLIVAPAGVPASSWMARFSAAVKQGWVPKEKLVHYALHAEIDERHAEEFFAVIEPKWDDQERRYFITQGLELGAYA